MSIRIQRINQLIKTELANLILREVDFPKDLLVTITGINCSSNLQSARVYISVLPNNRKKETLINLQRNIFSLQKKLDKILRMRPVPKIEFCYDEKPAEAARVEELLEEIKNQGK